MTRSFHRIVPAAAALSLLAGCLPNSANYGVSSVHRPVVAHGRAYVPGCPDWSSGGVDSAARTDSNFGCANATNLAAMIADPQDLVRGRDAGTEPSEVPTRSIKAWREVEPTSKQWKVTTQDSVSGGDPR
jgi:pilus assembly protein CpaD